MPIHDETGSCVVLAKQWLMDLDRTALTSTVQTATLIMLLDKLVELGMPEAVPMATARAMTVAEMVAEFKQRH